MSLEIVSKYEEKDRLTACFINEEGIFKEFNVVNSSTMEELPEETYQEEVAMSK